MRVYERSPVRGGRARRGAASGPDRATVRLRARRVVLATSAYTHHLLPARHPPVHPALRLHPGERAAHARPAGGDRLAPAPGRHRRPHLLQLLPPRPPTTGSCGAPARRRTTAGNRVDPSCDHSPAPLRVAARRACGATSPRSRTLEWPYAWGGPICSTTRLTPFFGRALGGRVHYGLGYTGHGLGTTRLAGRILAHHGAGPARASCWISRWSRGSRFPIRRSRCGRGRSPR